MNEIKTGTQSTAQTLRKLNVSPLRIGILFLFAVAAVSAAVHSVGDEAARSDTTGRAPAAETRNLQVSSKSNSQVHLVGSRLRGVNSCAAASCHGGGRAQEGIGFAASQIWARSDPHSRAWEVLTGPTARKMMAILNTDSETAPLRATEDARCLNCHVTTEDLLPLTTMDPLIYDHDGVGCESCHGPAADWLAVHSTPEWKTLTPNARQSLGFVDTTKSIVDRAKLCSQCHVGGDGRNVTHDLLAAGHPRLDFEFSTFHANVPVHWTARPGNAEIQSDPELRQDFAIHAWFTGQLVSAHSSLELLEHRTTQPDLWPDFAEHACFNCHHDLEDQNWYQLRSEARGRPAWGAWNFGLYPVVAAGQTEHTALQTLKQIMQHPVPDPRAAQINANSLKQLIGEQLRNVDTLRWNTERIDQLVVNLIRHCQVNAAGGASLPASSWDEAAQLYLALRAALISRNKLVPQDPLSSVLQAQLEILRRSLLFHPGADSPGSSSASRTKLMQSALQQIERLLTSNSDHPPIKATLPDHAPIESPPSRAGAASSETP